ncbi:MAG: ISAzo13 family transposase [Phycisphaerae bacterium]|nr:ISAzo13 family transposase [Phycisphaerae bacterium]
MDEAALKRKFAAMAPVLNERSRRFLAATEAREIGHGGIAMVARAAGISRSTVVRGVKELRSSETPDPDRIRRVGGGRRRLTDTDPTLMADLEGLIEPTVRGDPQSPLRWTCKSVRNLSEKLQEMGHSVSHDAVARLLREAGYSLQANRKAKEGSAHPDRNAQFEYINRRVRRQQRAGQPGISVDTKKKELVGDFANKGREWRPMGKPERVRVHDFMIKEKGKVAPYGVYDLTRNAGWISIGIDHDTATFAVNTIRRWWRNMGRKVYPRARSLLIMADSGGSNGSRVRLWKWELQRLANETGMSISVCHFPPGTSKWNKIEHRLFSYISQNWRGRPLTSLATIVNLIASTRTKTGLTVRCQVDMGRYPKGGKISDEQMAKINIRRARFHGHWNYTIHPQHKSQRQRRK